MDFKTVLKNLRVARGLTQSELATRLGLQRSRISMYELGQREPDFETIEAIADFFNVDVDYLLGRTDKTTVLPESYYLNASARDLAEYAHKDPRYGVAFDAVKNVPPEDLDIIIRLVKKWGSNNE